MRRVVLASLLVGCSAFGSDADAPAPPVDPRPGDDAGVDVAVVGDGSAADAGSDGVAPGIGCPRCVVWRPVGLANPIDLTCGGGGIDVVTSMGDVWMLPEGDEANGHKVKSTGYATRAVARDPIGNLWLATGVGVVQIEPNNAPVITDMYDALSIANSGATVYYVSSTAIRRHGTNLDVPLGSAMVAAPDIAAVGASTVYVAQGKEIQAYDVDANVRGPLATDTEPIVAISVSGTTLAWSTSDGRIVRYDHTGGSELPPSTIADGQTGVRGVCRSALGVTYWVRDDGSVTSMPDAN